MIKKNVDNPSFDLNTHFMFFVRKVQIILVCGLFFLPACAHDPVGKTYPVKGKVYLDGELLKAGSVTFFPAERGGDAPAFEASGKIKEDGTYELFTRHKTGALLGKYKVTVVLQTKPQSMKPDELKSESLVPMQYTNKEDTPLNVEVVEKLEEGKYELRMKSN